MINLNPIYINIAGYRFTPIDDVETTLDQLKSLCANLDIKGSIYLATEGINIGVSGNILEIQTFRSKLEQDARFSGMRFHELYSAQMPYRKMTVKTKSELVPIEDNTLKVGDFNHQYLPPLELKAWLDSGTLGPPSPKIRFNSLDVKSIVVEDGYGHRWPIPVGVRVPAAPEYECDFVNAR